MNLKRDGVFLTLLTASSIALNSNNSCLALDGATPELTSTNQPINKTATPTEFRSEKNSDQKPIFLWKCTKGNHTIYLLGTIHVARPGFYPLPLEMQKALAASKILFVEADALQLNQEKLTENLKRVGIYPPGTSLSEHISATTKDALKQFAEWSGESLSMYQPYKPWVVSQILTSAALRRAGYKSELGIDRNLLATAHDSGKKIIPLESIESQLNLMSSFDDSTQEKQLLGSILSLRQVKDQLEKLDNCWKNGDSDSLEKFCTEAGGKDSDDKDLEKVRVAILDKRNQSMLNEVKRNLPDSGTVMIAVGAAHLVGPKGLIAKLEEEKYSVQQESTPIKKQANSINFGGSNLKSLYFPEGLFRIMFPSEPEVKYETVNGIRMVDYAYSNLGGVMTISYIVLPKALPSADRQKQFMQLIASAIVKKIKGTNIGFVPLNNGANQTMQLSCKLPTKNGITNQETFFRSRMISSGRRLYLVGGQGSADFFNSKLFSQFENSLQIIPEAGYASTASTRNSNLGHSFVQETQPSSFGTSSRSTGLNSSNSSTSNTKFDFEAARKDHMRQAEELRRKVRNDFERTRQAIENSR